MGESTWRELIDMKNNFLICKAVLLGLLCFFNLGQLKAQTETEETEESVFKAVEKMPEFPGGQTALTAFLIDNVKYPYDDKMAKRQGVVMLRFIVEKDGSITNIETVPVKKEVEGTKAMEEEAYRVVRAMPKWEPGTQRGKTVRVSFMMPFQFFLGDDKKMKKAMKKMK